MQGVSLFMPLWGGYFCRLSNFDNHHLIRFPCTVFLYSSYDTIVIVGFFIIDVFAFMIETRFFSYVNFASLLFSHMDGNHDYENRVDDLVGMDDEVVVDDLVNEIPNDVVEVFDTLVNGVFDVEEDVYVDGDGCYENEIAAFVDRLPKIFETL